MSMSVPGNSCRPCSSATTTGCIMRLSGECVYYSGSSISSPGINVGDNFNSVVTKIIDYIDSVTVEIDANNGLSISANTITLGQNVGQSGDPATLVSGREIPLAGFNVSFSGSSGNIGVGNTSPSSRIHSTVSDSASNTISYPLRVEHITSGSVAANFGVGSIYDAENASGTSKTIGRLNFYYTSATNTQEDSSFSVDLMYNGALLRRMYLDSEANLHLVGAGGGVPAGIYFDTGTTNLIYGDNIRLNYRSPSHAFQDGIGNDRVQIAVADSHMLISAGSATHAPIVFASGPFTTTIVDGALEFTGTHLYIAIAGTRYQLDQQTNSSVVTPYTSADFDVDGVTVTDATLNGKTFELFLNDLNRFIYNEVGNQEWDYVVGGGFEIMIPGFDANANDYHLYLFLKS